MLSRSFKALHDKANRDPLAVLANNIAFSAFRPASSMALLIRRSTPVETA
jgi:hypothetical protein